MNRKHANVIQSLRKVNKKSLSNSYGAQNRRHTLSKIKAASYLDI